MITKYILPIVAVIGTVFAVMFVRAGNQPVPASQPVADPAQAPFSTYVAGAGIVESSSENIAIGTFVPGVVTALYHTFGDHVKAGEPLFKIDTRDIEAELAVRKAALTSAEANVDALQAMDEDAENQWKLVQDMKDSRAMSREDMDRRRFAAANADAKLLQAKADVINAKAQIQQSEIDLSRRTVNAPVDGTVLQCKIHLGEYAQAGPLDPPLMLMGNIDTMNIRTDIDENDAWRLHTNQPAMAYVRGNRSLSAPLHFVRIEPYVIPKKSLTGDSTERVDTRVLQVIYGFDPKQLNVFVGQQMDVFIEAPPIAGSSAYTSQSADQAQH